MPASTSATIAATVNGQARQLDTTPDRTLLEVLREDLGLTGTHSGCGEGDCGACAMLVDGKRTLACQTRVDTIAGTAIITIEGLANGEILHPVQQVFLDENGFQCGFCTPGMICSVVGHLNDDPHITDNALLEKMNRNLCRCCGYARIGVAIRNAAAAVRATKKEGRR